MPDIYKNKSDKLADIVLANINPIIRLTPTQNGKFALTSTTPLEKAVILEDQTEAITRLALDHAMRP